MDFVFLTIVAMNRIKDNFFMAGSCFYYIIIFDYCSKNIVKDTSTR